MRFSTLLRFAFPFLMLGASSSPHAGEVEVLHYWTSGGEAKSLAELKSAMAARGHGWKDFTVTGGGGQNAMVALKQRVLSGHPPAAALIKGPTIQEWAELKVLTNLDSMASFDKWDDSLPKVVADQMKYRGHYVAVPVNVHRVNWLWASSSVLAKAGVKEMPQTFDDFFLAADKIKAAGFVPLAHGGQDWQDFTVFESVALGVGGPEFYTKALVKLEAAALGSEEMKRSLLMFRRLKGYIDDKSPGRDWNATTDMVIKGKAGFQFMGDWAKGEFLSAGQQVGREFNCIAAPGTAAAYTFNVDSFAMFELKGWEAQKAQGYLAYLIMGRDFQEGFNLRKGSIPARLGADMAKFDDCAKTSSRDFATASKAGTLVPSVAHGMAVPAAAQGLLRAAVSDYWNDDKLSVAATIAKMQTINAVSLAATNAPKAK